MAVFPYPVKAPLGGLVKNLHPSLVPPGVAVDGRNVRFYLGGVEKTKGFAAWGPGFPDPVMFVTNYKRRNGTNQLVAITTKKAYRWDTGAWVEITPAGGFSGSAQSFFSVSVVEDLLLVVNGLDAPQKYTGADTMVDLGGAPPVGWFVRNFNGHAIIGRLSDAPQGFAFAKWGQPEVWSGVGSGRIILADTPGTLLTMEPFQRYMIAYKEDGIYLGSYLGAPLYFSFVPVAQVGLIAPRAVTHVPKLGHLFVGPDNVYLFNGVTPEPIGNVIRDEMFSLMNPSRQDMTFCFTPNDAEAVVAFCSANSDTPDLAYIYNYAEGKWSPLVDFPAMCFCPYVLEADVSIDNLDQTWDTADFAWDQRNLLANAPTMLVGGADGSIKEWAGNSVAEGWVQFGLSDLAIEQYGVMPEQFKRVRRLYVDTGNDGPHSLEVSVGHTSYRDKPVTWENPQYMKMDGSGAPYIDLDVVDKFFTVRFRTANVDEPFKVLGFSWQFAPWGV